MDAVLALRGNYGPSASALQQPSYADLLADLDRQVDDMGALFLRVKAAGGNTTPIPGWGHIPQKWRDLVEERARKKGHPTPQ